MWPELKKAKQNAREISNETERLLKEHNTLSKNEISSHSEKLLVETEDAINIIKEQSNELRQNMESHKKQLISKIRFFKRHYRIGK